MAARWLCISVLSLILAACGGGSDTREGTDGQSGQSPTAGGTSGEGISGEGTSGGSGGGTSGGDGGSGSGTDSPASDFAHDSTARFNTPGTLSIDSDGTLYVMDDGNNMLRRIAADGDVTTLPGTYSMAKAAQRSDANGNLHILSDRRVYRVSPDGERTLVREFATGPGSHDPTAIAADSQGNVYVLLKYRNLHEIWRIDDNRNAHLAYSGSTYGDVTALASDSAGNLALATNGPVPDTASIRYIPRSSQPAEYDTQGVSVVAAAVNFLPKSMIIDEAGNAYLHDVSVQQIDGQYYYRGMHIFRVAPNGVVTTLLDRFPDGSADERPVQTGRWFVNAGLALDANGRLYFSDPRSHAIYRMDSAGNLSLIAGTPGEAGSSN